jgi:RHS repeat-associated protein
MARVLRVEARIFLLQLLCLLLVLQGEPLYALDRMAAAAAARPAGEAEEAPAPAPLAPAEAAPAEAAPAEAAAAAPEPAEEEKPSGGEPAEGEGGSVWSSLLATLRFAALAEPGPPSPPTKRSSFALPVGGPPTPFPQGSALEAVPVYTGWNLISLPEEPADPAPAAVFSSIAGQVSEAFTYDHCDGGDPWKRYAPGDPAGSDLTSVDVKRGLWVDATAPVLLPSSGTLPATTTIPLCPGWNLIGFPAGQARHPLTVLAPIAGKYLRLYGYDASQPQPWAVFDPNVPIWANDLQLMEPGRGYWLLATEATPLEIPNEDPAGPDVALLVPADLAVVTKPTDVFGRVSGKLLESWSLSYRATGEADWKEIVTKRYPVDGKLGTFDPTLLLNGLYDLKLEAVDTNGLAIWDEIAVSVEGNMKIGNFTVSFVDLQIDMAGIPIQVIRTYDSRQKDKKGDFGYGWTLDIRQGTYRTNGPVGRNWQIEEGYEYAEGYPVVVPCHDSVELRGHTASVRLSDQEYFRFRPVLYDMGPTPGGCFAKVGFAEVSGFTPGAKLEIVGNKDVFFVNDSNELVDLVTLELFDVGRVRLETRDGRKFEVDKADGIQLIRDSNDNQLTITSGEITHSGGLSVALTRDGQGRITKITDVLGNDLVYDYDGASDLVTFKDREGAQTRFAYTSHYLDSIVDPLGRPAIRNEYGEDGRLIQNLDAFGNEIKFEHNLAANQELVTNRLGKSRLLEYDDRGNVTREVDELGKATVRTFDGDNLLTETNPLGHTTVNTYDQKNLASTKNPLGHITHFTYNARGDLLTIKDPLGNVTTNVYDAKGNLESITDAQNHTTSYTYDRFGLRLTEEDAHGNLTTYEYNEYGKLVRETDASGHVTQYNHNLLGNRTWESTTRTRGDGSTEILVRRYGYDRQQRPTATVGPDDGLTRTEYDALGRVSTTVDPLGRRTAFTYDELGRQIRTTFPDGLYDEKVYDAENRLLESKDRGGRVTHFAYDHTGRLLTTSHPGGGVTQNVYDDAGRLTTTIDARNKATRFEYDDAGRRRKTVNALDFATEFGYDAGGNQTSVKDARGFTTTFFYDTLNRHTRTVFPDLSETVTEYDELGRRISEKDQAGKITRFGYDDLGRLTNVTDALNQITRYAYDEVGNRVSQTDANQHVTRFEFDAAGRQIKRTLPDGAFETATYDLAGNQKSRTDFKGITTQYEHDTRNRLTKRLYPGGQQVRFTYTATGRRKTAVDARGTTAYEYDERDRLQTLIYPDGRQLRYAYDLNGNRSAVTAAIGGAVLTTSYTYDAQNRLASITDPEGGVSTQSYDNNGNRATLEHSNGVITTYDYDPLNRLEGINAVSSHGESVTSFRYTLGPTGNRTKIVELDRTTKDYFYDDLYRLTSEVVTQGGAPRWSNLFAYDSVGNRQSQNRVEIGGAARNVPYTYDSRDRLLTEGSVNYGWDANGNLISKSGSDGAQYQWDFENRLTKVTLATGTTVENTYDVDGTRVRTVTTPAGGAAQTVDYLVDTSKFPGVVIAESAAQSLGAYYVVGAELTAVIRPEGNGHLGSLTYHLDSIGSVRASSTPQAVVDAVWQYEAFGAPLPIDGSGSNSFLFASLALEPKSTWYYNYSRWLLPSIGRFGSADLYSGWTPQPGTLNKYVYALNGPADNVDPTGFFADGSVAGLSVANKIGVQLDTRVAVLSLAVAIELVCRALLVSGVTNDVCGDSSEEIKVFRGLTKTNPGSFRFDEDGLSTFEIPRPGYMRDGKFEPYIWQLPFTIRYLKPKIPGVTGPVVNPAFPGIALTGTYTPGESPDHWSINYSGADLDSVRKELADYAKRLFK